MKQSEVIELLKQYGPKIGEQANEGDKVAKAVVDAYEIFLRRNQEASALKVVECTLELWLEKNLAKG